MQLVSDFESRHHAAQAGALTHFGFATVESLYYLADLDTVDDLSQHTFNGHRPDVVDVAHGRWATTGCITALDLFEAALARVFCGHTADRELSIADFTTKKKAAQLLAQLPVSAHQWITDVAADSDYRTVKSLRDSLVHARVRRHFTMPRQRLQIEAGTARLAVPAVVALSRDTATKHALAHLAILPTL